MEYHIFNQKTKSQKVKIKAAIASILLVLNPMSALAYPQPTGLWQLFARGDDDTQVFLDVGSVQNQANGFVAWIRFLPQSDRRIFEYISFNCPARQYKILYAETFNQNGQLLSHSSDFSVRAIPEHSYMSLVWAGNCKHN